MAEHVPCAPCLPQRPRAWARVSQSFTVHSFLPHGLLFPPTCLVQCCDPAFALVVHPLVAHVSYAPCFLQRPRACARVSQYFTMHSFELPPPCLQHLPVLAAAVLQLPKEQNPRTPCFPQRPCATILLGQSGIEHTSYAPCFAQSPRAATLLVQPGVEHNKFGSCLLQ